MSMKLRRTVAVAALAGFLGLGACDDKNEQVPEVRNTTETQTPEQSAAGAKLLEALSTPQLEGGRLSVIPGDLQVSIFKGETARADTRIRNEGDTPVTISSVDTAVRTADMAFDKDGCAPGVVLAPGAACDLFVSYHDTTGYPASNDVVIGSNAKKTPTVKVAFAAEIKAPPAQPQPGVQVKPAPKKSNIDYAAIAMANQKRAQSGWGNLPAMPAEAVTKVETSQQGYDEGAFPSTKASLPVDRRNILTQDRVVHAVLETPFNNIMCSQVIAVTDSDTWGADQLPSRDKALLPAGTRFIGTCRAFTDEKAAVAWTRFITPDGRSANIIGAANDAMGRGGLSGILDRRWFDKYGIPVIFSSLRSVLQYALTSGSDATSSVTNPELGITTNTETPETKAIDRFQGDMDNILGGIIDDLKDTKEVLNVPAGTRIDIIMLQDVYFKDSQTVVAMGDDEYELPEKKRQQLYRTQPTAVLAGAEGGSVPRPQGAQSVTINGQQYWLTPAQAAGDETQQGGTTQQQSQAQGGTTGGGKVIVTQGGIKMDEHGQYISGPGATQIGGDPTANYPAGTPGAAEQ